MGIKARQVCRLHTVTPPTPETHPPSLIPQKSIQTSQVSSSSPLLPMNDHSQHLQHTPGPSSLTPIPPPPFDSGNARVAMPTCVTEGGCFLRGGTVTGTCIYTTLIEAETSLAVFFGIFFGISTTSSISFSLGGVSTTRHCHVRHPAIVVSSHLQIVPSPRQVYR